MKQPKRVYLTPVIGVEFVTIEYSIAASSANFTLEEQGVTVGPAIIEELPQSDNEDIYM